METVKENHLEDEQIPDFALPEESAPASVKRPRKRLVWALAFAGAAAAGTLAWQSFSKPAASGYTVVTVRRGNIANTINATGKVQAVTTVQVGTQVSGTVSELHADFNDHVKAGQIIARLDPSQIEAQLQQAKASYAATQAAAATVRSNGDSQAQAVLAAKANVDRAASALLEADRAYRNTAALVEAGVTPARQLETSEAARAQAAAQKAQADAQYNQAVAQAQASRSQLDQAVAQATQSKASVDVAAVNLERTIIRAPIDGVVVARNVDVGQTVAASLQAPTLFLIAQDLTKMQVLADIDEADVGQLSPESKVTFTVDAFPRETFEGKISQIRLSPNVVQNVVTYTAVVSVGNPKLMLKPGMTANVTATVAEKQNVLMVPSAALRFRPETAQAPAAAAAKSGRKGGGARGSGAILYQVDGTELKPVRVQLGMTDGIFTELTGGGLPEGARVAAPGQQQAASQPQQPAQSSPFSGRGAGAGAGRRGRF
ncbi:MAG TPA: efflux RND transporter periplasmic adaptor subunit [Bryobacteraceae bacterium]|jgi:HlyD family secretion protein|nr:efflux RND transporter periplasmic adaptor subunit [Bryobacteraceae bacterium]